MHGVTNTVCILSVVQVTKLFLFFCRSVMIVNTVGVTRQTTAGETGDFIVKFIRAHAPIIFSHFPKMHIKQG